MASRYQQQSDNEFTEMYISKVWEELHTRFGFNLKYWKLEFSKYLDNQNRATPVEDVFYRFGADHINPILNSILGRRQGYPTWQNLCEYVVTGKKKTG